MKINQISAALAMFAVSGSLMAQTLVSVNGSQIDSSAVEKRVQLIQAQSQSKLPDSPELRNAVLSDLITEEIVLQEARRLKLDQSSKYKQIESDALKEIKSKGLDKKPDFKTQWSEFQKGLLMDAYNYDVVSKNPVSEADIKKRYDEVNKRVAGTNEVQFGWIVTDKADQAQAALKELAAKKPFAEVAAKYSQAANKDAALTQGYVPEIDLPEGNPNLRQIVAGLGKEQYTQTPVQAENRSVIVYVKDKRPVTVQPFNQEVQEVIKNALLEERVEGALDALVQKAKVVPAK